MDLLDTIQSGFGSTLGAVIGSLMSASSPSAYLMTWLITVLIRLATGQGVVSAITAGGASSPVR